MTAQHRTRDELLREFTDAGIKINENRASHLFVMAELEGLICSGPSENGKQTYALLENRVPKKNLMPREESLATLALRYFKSHGPATTGDFMWWSGLSVRDAKAGVEMIKKELVSETIGSSTYLFHRDSVIPDTGKKSTFLLPAYDEFVISYKDRSAILDTENHKKAVSVNGIFKPLIILNGQVTGLWKRTLTKDSVVIETEFFRPHKKTELARISKAAEAVGKFLGKQVELKSVH